MSETESVASDSDGDERGATRAAAGKEVPFRSLTEEDMIFGTLMCNLDLEDTSGSLEDSERRG